VGVGYEVEIANAASRAVALGTNATIDGSACDSSIAIGAHALVSSTPNFNSIAIGAKSEVDSTGAIAIGGNAASSAFRAVALGYGADAEEGSLSAIAIGERSVVSGANSIAIGSGATVSADNEVYIGNAATANIGGIVNWTATSDGRFKRNIQANVPGLDFINRLRPVTYTFDTKSIYEFEDKPVPINLQDALKQKDLELQSGFVAQEVLEAARSSGYDFSGVKIPANQDEEAYGLRYAEFVVPLVKATQELSQQVKDQQQLIEQQQAMLQAYQQQMSQMSARLEAVEAKAEAIPPSRTLTKRK
jgi:uncharacterized coiled-coil protein SlyX/autotransporter adhesin